MTAIEQANTGFSSRPSTCQPGCVRAQAYLGHKFDGSNLGCYNPRSTLSGGGPSWHVYGKAIDMGFNWYDASQRARGDACFDWVLANKESFGLQQMIWGERIYDIRYGGVRAYRPNDHKNHVHIAFSYEASQVWRVPEGPPIPPPEDDDMQELIQGPAGGGPQADAIWCFTGNTKWWVAAGNSDALKRLQDGGLVPAGKPTRIAQYDLDTIPAVGYVPNGYNGAKITDNSAR